MRSPMVMLGSIVAAILLVVLGVYFQLSHTSSHVVSYKALAAWGLAVVALIVASFARPEKV